MRNLIIKNEEKALVLYENERKLKAFIHLGKIKVDFKEKEIKAVREFDDLIENLYQRRYSYVR